MKDLLLVFTLSLRKFCVAIWQTKSKNCINSTIVSGGDYTIAVLKSLVAFQSLNEKAITEVNKLLYTFLWN